MRVNVDSKALNDARIKRAALLLKKHHRHVLGDLLFVWTECYERRTPYVSDIDIDAQTEPGFAAVMVAVGLATEVPPGTPLGRPGELPAGRPTEAPPGTLRVAGVTDRIDWLKIQDAKREMAREAKNLGKRKRDDNKVSPGTSRGDFPRDVPISPSPAPSLFPEDAASAATSDNEPGHRDVVDAFDRGFRSVNGGKGPTWGAKQGKQVKALIKQHGAPEVIARIGRLFSGRGPNWPPQPWDLGTFVAHFDKLAADAPPRAPPIGAATHSRDPYRPPIRKL